MTCRRDQDRDQPVGLRRDPSSLQVRPPIGVESRLSKSLSRHRWYCFEVPLCQPGLQRIIVSDGELVGATSLRRVDLVADLDTLSRHTCRDALSDFAEPAPTGNWVVSSGLFVDRRLPGRIGARRWRRQARRIGPVAAALYCRRFGLTGYVAAVAMSAFDDHAPAVGPAAYAQQVGAGAIEDPILSAHLGAGARVVAVVESTAPPLAVVRWRR